LPAERVRLGLKVTWDRSACLGSRPEGRRPALRAAPGGDGSNLYSPWQCRIEATGLVARQSFFPGVQPAPRCPVHISTGIEARAERRPTGRRIPVDMWAASPTGTTRNRAPGLPGPDTFLSAQTIAEHQLAGADHHHPDPGPGAQGPRPTRSTPRPGLALPCPHHRTTAAGSAPPAPAGQLHARPTGDSLPKHGDAAPVAIGRRPETRLRGSADLRASRAIAREDLRGAAAIRRPPAGGPWSRTAGHGRCKMSCFMSAIIRHDLQPCR
jgi:hypothetical protein